MVVFHDILCMCCVYIRNVQHHIGPIVLKAARKEISVFHIREQLRLSQARTFETKTPGLVSIQTVWHLNFEITKCPEFFFYHDAKISPTKAFVTWFEV